jgi:signal transduction histidine kinase
MAGLTPQPEMVDLFEFCSEVTQETQQMAQGKHRIVFASSGGCPQVLIDVKLLRQILFNLLSNATKYSPDGGTVTLLLHCDEQEFVLQVKDQGMGIPADGRDRIFDTFHRATNVGSIPGTGLGLAIVKRAVDALDGTIDFESQEGIGTTFFVRIPMTRG